MRGGIGAPTHRHNPTLPMLVGWTVHGERYLRQRCNDCGRWRPWQVLYEGYPPLSEAERGWWYLCAQCLIEHVTEKTAAPCAHCEVPLAHRGQLVRPALNPNNHDDNRLYWSRRSRRLESKHDDDTNDQGTD